MLNDNPMALPTFMFLVLCITVYACLHLKYSFQRWRLTIENQCKHDYIKTTTRFNPIGDGLGYDLHVHTCSKCPWVKTTQVFDDGTVEESEE